MLRHCILQCASRGDAVGENRGGYGKPVPVPYPWGQAVKDLLPEDTARNGSDISMLVAHAFREMAKASDIAIQNGGGVRTDIAKGTLTMGDAYKLPLRKYAC